MPTWATPVYISKCGTTCLLTWAPLHQEWRHHLATSQKPQNARLEETSMIISSNLFGKSTLQTIWILSSWILNVSSVGESTTSWGTLFQRLIVLIVKILLLCSMKMSPRVICTYYPCFSKSLLVKRELPSYLQSILKYWYTVIRFSLSLPSRLNIPSSSSLSSHSRLLSPLTHLCGSFLDSIQLFHISTYFFVQQG